MEFKLVCNLCHKIVKGNPLEHMKKNHSPIEYFTLVPVMEWSEDEADKAPDNS